MNHLEKKGTALGAPIWVPSWPQRSRPSYQPAAEPSMAVEYQRRRRCSSAAVDIAGAFDKVSHVGVLHKLCAYGINGILHRWLTSYLSNRNLQAVVGGATSQDFPVTAGVPQGSILGPTLFIVYVNDAPDVLPANTVPATYADDTTLFSLIPSIDDAPARCTEFQSGVDALSKWGSTWRVKFEPSKSQATTISRHLRPWPFYPVKFDGVTVEEANSDAQTPWSDFDKTLSFGQHQRSLTVAVRAARRIGFLRKASAVLDIPGRLTTCKGFVRPLIVYSPLVWSGAAACHLSRLDQIQRRALSFLGPGVIVGSLELRRTISGLCMLHKLMCGPRSPCLLPLLPRQAHHTPPPPPPIRVHSNKRKYQSSGHNLQFSLSLPPRSNNTILRSFPHALIKTWSSLPPSILHE